MSRDAPPPPQASCIYQQANHHNYSITFSSSLFRLYGRVTAVSLEICEPMTFHNKAATLAATTKQSTTVTGSSEESGTDAMFRLSDASVNHLLQWFPCYEHRVSSLRDVGLRLDPSSVHLGDFTSMPLGSFVEISVTIPAAAAAAATNSSSLPTSSSQQWPQHGSSQQVVVLYVHDIRIPSSSHIDSTAALLSSSAERIASLVGWVPSKFQYLVDRWCPHVAGHRNAKELLMLVALALRLDITTTTTTSNDQERSSAPLRVLLRGPKGCGKTLLLAAFENLHDSLHTLVIGTTSTSGRGTAAKQNPVAPGGTRRGSGGGGGGGLSATKSPIDPDVLLPHIAPLPSAGSSAQCQYYGNSYSSSVVVALHCGQLLSSSVVLVDDWNNVSSASSCGPAGSMPRAIIDVLLDDTWALPMAPSSAARFQSSASGGGGNCLAVERIAGLQRGRFVIATDTADAKKPLSATASQDMYAKFHFIVALDVVSMEADASVVASQAIREASQMSRQRLASVSSSALGVGRSQSQLLSQSMLSCNGRRSCSTNSNNISSRSFGEDDGGFSSSISAFFNNGDDVLSSEKHLSRCETMGGGNMPLPREQTARQPSQCQPTPISTADILDEVAREFSRGDTPTHQQRRQKQEEGFLHAWVMYLLTTSGDQHPTQQQQWLIPFLGSNSSIIASSSSSSFSHLPPLCELLDGVIRDDVPGFADAIVRLGVARHALDPDLPLVPDCMIDVLRVVASSTTTSSATSSLQSHGNGASDDSAVAAAAQRKRLRCINGGEDSNPLSGSGNKKKLVGKKQIARRFHAALHQSSQSGTFENGEVPVGVCRVLFDKSVAAISGGVVAPGGGSGVMFEEIVSSLSYDGMLLKGKNGALKPL